jgi:hypothetical protein
MGKIHPNVLKLKKQQRMRRAYLKPYSAAMVKVPMSNSKAHIPEDAQALFDYRGRAYGYFLDLFDKRGVTMLSKERMAVLHRLSEMLHDVAPECNVILRRGGITKTIIRMYFTPDFHLCYFMKEDWRSGDMYKSMSYHGNGARERAMFAFDNNRIEWVDRVPIPITSPESPSG